MFALGAIHWFVGWINWTSYPASLVWASGLEWSRYSWLLVRLRPVKHQCWLWRDKHVCTPFCLEGHHRDNLWVHLGGACLQVGTIVVMYLWVPLRGWTMLCGKVSLSSSGRGERSDPTRIKGDANLSDTLAKIDDFSTLFTYYTYFSLLSCAIWLSDWIACWLLPILLGLISWLDILFTSLFRP
jgi:hypothetical protein